MKFHYHRGWTLTQLGRNEEAVAELTTGIQQQPDYAWAYLRRACASARLGRVSAALIDQRRGVALLEQMPPAPPPLDGALKRGRAVITELEAADRAASGRPSEAACTGYPDPEARRAQSALFPG